MQFKIKANQDVIFQWIPYNQFDEIIETGKNCFMTVYSAKWNNKRIRNYERDSNKEVILKCLHNSQNPIDSLIYEVKKYYCRHKFLKIYGMSQNQDTKDFVLVQNNFIWTSENKQINNFVQEMQLEIKDNNDIVFEWIPYSQFYEIKETGKNGLVTVYSAIWKDGPLCYAHNDYKRNMYEKVALKCWHNSENPIESLINEVKKHTSNKFKNRPNIAELTKSLWSITIKNSEIERAENYRNLELSSESLKEDRQITTHPQAIYTSRLLNPFTENLPKYNDGHSECLDCEIPK
ncbi:unnamed protein product [Rhizophagus irregularis]|nr:unnamed protein product [Rhizophagus irregularis]